MLNNSKDQVFKLYASCIPVKGANRSVICDLQRSKTDFIPNGLFQILTEYPNMNKSELYELFENKYNNVIDEYFTFLEEKEYGFWIDTEEANFFPPLSMEWDNPSQITNAIIDSNENTNHHFQKIFLQLEELACSALQLRFYDFISLNGLDEILTLLNTSCVLSIELLIKFSDECSEDSLKGLIKKHPRITNLFVHSSNNKKVVRDDSKIGNIIYISQIIDSASHCGIVSPDYFSVNIPLFTEAQNYNTCLNRKISIDIDGNIKNCPSMNKSFGNISETSLLSVIENQEFVKMWTIKKDDIEVCKDCEFRYICTDCRAYINKPENEYSKPAKCPYNPYNSKGF